MQEQIPLQPVEMTWGGPHAEAGGCAQRRLWPRGKSMLEQVCWQDL